MPSRLITHRGGMAAPMDLSDSEGGRGKSGSALSVSRSSSKINKNLRRAVTQPRPAPQVYKTEPADFRSLVQQLTGTTPPAESSSILTPKPLNPRLQKIAPPPLRPVFSYPTLPQQQPQQQTLSNFNPGPRRLNSMPASMNYPNQLASQRPSNFAVSPLSFSPLPALSPRDQIWANVMNPLESPGSAAMRHLAQSMAGGSTRHESGISLPPPMQPHSTNFSNSNLPLEFSRFGGSPLLRFSPPFNLSSPGMPSGHDLGNIYGLSDQFAPAASLAMENSFSFPEQDIPRSTYS